MDIIKEDNPDKIDDELYKTLLDDILDENSCDAFCATSSNGGSYIIYIREGFEDKYRVVIHELFHLTNRILCDRGVYHKVTTKAWAYLIGWLSEQYFNILNKHINK